MYDLSISIEEYLIVRKKKLNPLRIEKYRQTYCKLQTDAKVLLRTFIGVLNQRGKRIPPLTSCDFDIHRAALNIKKSLNQVS